MNEAEYRADEAKYLRQLAEAMGIFHDQTYDEINVAVEIDGKHSHITSFSPEHDAEQLLELLCFYSRRLPFAAADELMIICNLLITIPSALILASLELINAE